MKGMLNLGRNRLLISLISREVMVMGSFSDSTSVVVVEEGGGGEGVERAERHGSGGRLIMISGCSGVGFDYYV